MPLLETKGAASAQGFGLTLGGAQPLYIEDVFSTWLYTGNGSTQTITNGIDLAGKGGMVWQKARSAASSHYLFDTARGPRQILSSNNTNASSNFNESLTAFNSDGFTLGFNLSNSGETDVTWTFRKQPKFFDVVTGTADANGDVVFNTSIDSIGFVTVKSTSNTSQWFTYHRSLGNAGLLYLNSTSGDLGIQRFTVSGSTVTLSNQATGYTFVAYVWAHDTSTDGVIQCGSFTTDGNGNASVTLGWEPQWMILKRSSGVSDWAMQDSMRGWTVGSPTGDMTLYANSSGAENAQTVDYWSPSATGFTTTGAMGSGTYIYIAIRRGPMKVPTDGTKVFAPVAYSGTGANNSITSAGFPPDMFFSKIRQSDNGYQNMMFDRLRGAGQYLIPTSTDAEGPSSNIQLSFNMGGVTLGAGNNANGSGSTYADYFFRRAPGFFDVVCYTGTGSAQTLSHNLTVAPELIITKQRSAAGEGWATGTQFGTTYKYLLVNSTAAATTRTAAGDNFYRTVSATTYDIGIAATLNNSGSTYVAYLFASCPGVSKVGSYSGTGAAQTINCGFAAGARFVLIKRTDSTGDWYVWDSARGITSGNDPYLLLNSTAAEVTGTNYVDTAASGFQITSSAPAAINASGGSFIFLAIA